MDNYVIDFVRSARKELESLDDSLVNRIFPKIEGLSKNPRPRGCRKLQGENNLWRIRVGDYRIIYAISDPERKIDIFSVEHRSKAYD